MVEEATRGRSSGTVLDLGGGTANARSLWPDDWDYLSVDPDQRLATLENADQKMHRLVGDASQLGLVADSIDVVLMKNVSHHLDDTTWSGALSEVRRILKPDGYFIFVDALWTQNRIVSRLAWTVDAGRFPRVSDKIEDAIATAFDVESVERLTLIHHCILLITRPRSESSLS
jgi:SAM-dependent methyltransferase